MIPKDSKRRMPYACFECCKAFQFDFMYPSQRLQVAKQQAYRQLKAGRPHKPLQLPPEQQHLCPECGGQLFRMGLYFRAPRQRNVAAWEAAELLIMAGFDYGGYQGRLPTKPAAARQFIAERAIRSPGGRLAERIKKVKETQK